MREVDRLMVDEYGIQLIQMMENAGRHLAGLSRALIGPPAGQRILVACGKGNNGGGGLAAARHLANWGADVTIGIESADRLADVPAAQWKALRGLPVRKVEGDAAIAAVDPGAHALAIDALIGYGLRGEPRGWIASMIDRLNAVRTLVLALDVPSGLDSTTGRAAGRTIRAAATMTLALPKAGLFAPEAKPFVGKLFLADLGVPPVLYERIGLRVGALFSDAELIPLG
ncbi:MAG TPA: NAD(P)H-hydrate epimerase [bacterium]|jgi:NAD(P)H-hydrate epimerase|nr:NAD(P)H-hydrate epimerase [bacterium]